MNKIIRALVGQDSSEYSTGSDKIVRFWDAIKWLVGSLPGWDASVQEGGGVHLFRMK